MKITKTISWVLCSLLLFALSTSCEKSDQDEPEQEEELEEENIFIDSRDGKQYKWVQIGGQVWMAENLAYLPSVNALSEESMTEPCYYVYGYDGTIIAEAKSADNYTKYGVLYNWPAAAAACPAGWHLPADADWKVMETFLGMSQEEADKIGYRGTDEGSQLAGNSLLWNTGSLKNNAAFGKSGFLGLPAGFLYNGTTSGLGRDCKWWSDEISSTRALDRSLYYSGALVGRGDASLKKYGYSVRCVKN
ncbi:MAG: fibrobacter succinogenes major paralogous domain-containing protein [Lentimicrobium sp.]|nr:fibrobacter succinogenes major paralogous domain-containing protein [Lentimicrobium sp.]